jgi:hypothetical protein
VASSLQIVVVVHKNLGNIYRVEIELRAAKFTIDTHSPALFDQRIEIVAAKSA